MQGYLKVVWNYIYRNCESISILMNTLTGGANRQTFSARNWGWKRENKPNLVWLIDGIFFLAPDHCMTKWIYWRLRKDVHHEIELTEIMKDVENDYIGHGSGYPH